MSSSKNSRAVEQIPLGSQGLKVSRVGFGGMSLSHHGGTEERPLEQLVEVIGTAIDLGVNYFDTGDFYGAGHNETVFGQAIKKYGRDKFILNVKTGAIFDESTRIISFEKGAQGSRDFLRTQIEGSLRRLGVDQIDIYTLSRVDPNTPIEDSVAAIAELIKEGKVKYIGLSECSAETLRKAHKVHPITCIQTEYSMATTDREQDLIPTCKELGVGFLAYSVLGRGLLSGVNNVGEKDFRKAMFPRFQGEAYDRNQKLVAEVGLIAQSKGCTVSQVAIAWVHRNPEIHSILGASQVANVKSNVEALNYSVTDEEDKKIREIMSKIEGERYNVHAMKAVGL